MSPTTSEHSPTGSRSSAALVLDRSFGPWFWGNISSNSGNWLFNVTAAIVVFELGGSAFLVGLVSVAQFTPMLVLSPWVGALSDQVDRRRLLLVGLSISLVAATAIAAPAVVFGVEGLPGAWPVLLAALGLGVGKAVATPPMNSLVPSLVPDPDLEKAVSLTTLTFQFGRALGPAGAGVLLTTLGAETAFVLNAVSFVVFVVALLAIPRGRAVSGSAEDGKDNSVRDGLRHVRGDREIVILLAGVMTVGVAADPVITLAPPLTAALGAGDAFVAAMVSGFGVMAIPGAIVSGTMQRRVGSMSAAALGMLVMAAGLLTAAIAPTPWLAVAGFAATGAGMSLGVTSFTSRLHRRVPDRLRGRVMALWSIALLGSRPLAAMLDGAAADVFGPRFAMAVGIAAALLGTWAAVRLRGRGQEWGVGSKT